LLLTFISGVNNIFKKHQKKMRTVEERHDSMKAIMEVLMSKFDEMISRQRVPSHKKKGS
jgi:hypothetical protein